MSDKVIDIAYQSHTTISNIEVQLAVALQRFVIVLYLFIVVAFCF